MSNKGMQIWFKKQNDRMKKRRKKDMKQGYVYLIELTTSNETRYKIGYSKQPKTRLKQLKTVIPFDLKIIHTIKTNDMATLEILFHKMLRRKNVDFKVKKHKGEWFILTKDDMSFIKQIQEYNFDINKKYKYYHINLYSRYRHHNTLVTKQ